LNLTIFKTALREKSNPCGTSLNVATYMRGCSMFYGERKENSIIKKLGLRGNLTLR